MVISIGNRLLQFYISVLEHPVYEKQFHIVLHLSLHIIVSLFNSTIWKAIKKADTIFRIDDCIPSNLHFLILRPRTIETACTSWLSVKKLHIQKNVTAQTSRRWINGRGWCTRMTTEIKIAKMHITRPALAFCTQILAEVGNFFGSFSVFPRSIIFKWELGGLASTLIAWSHR